MLTADPIGQFELAVLVDEGAEQQHICATCKNKERIFLTTEDGSQYAGVWRCRELTQRFRMEVYVEPNGSCYESKSLTDYYSPANVEDLVW